MKYEVWAEVGIRGGEWTKALGIRQKQLLWRIRKRFSQHRPRFDLGGVLFEDAPASLAAELRRFVQVHVDNADFRTDIGGREHPSLSDLYRARYVPFGTLEDCLALGEDKEGDVVDLNPPTKVLCNVCGRKDQVSIPTVFRVASRVQRHGGEVFNALVGVFVVKERVLKLLKPIVGSQIEHGPVSMVSKSAGSQRQRGEKVTPGWWWIRPKRWTGPMLGDWRAGKFCARCGVPTDRTRRFRRRMFKEAVVERYGPADADIAMMPWWTDSMSDPRRTCTLGDLAISGRLFKRLKSSGVKGLWTPDHIVYSNDKRESPWHPKPDFADEGGPAPEGRPRDRLHAAAVAEGRAMVQRYESLPWDRDKDGYIYFYLTTPRLALADPMTLGSYLTLRLGRFKPGVYRVSASAIRAIDGGGRGADVDSASVILIDGAFCDALSEAFEWEKSVRRGSRWSYYQQVAEQIGNRFGFCSLPADGRYTIDVRAVERFTG